MKYTLLMFCFLITAAKSTGYRYIGVAGDIVVLKDGTEKLFVRIGTYIPNTDLIIWGTDNRGAITSGGIIGHQESSKEEAFVPELRFSVGECILSTYPVGILKIVDIVDEHYITKHTKTSADERLLIKLVDDYAISAICPLESAKQEPNK